MSFMDAAATNGNHGPALCGRPKRQGDHSPCLKAAGWGTDHVGIGPCRNHGGMLPGVQKAARRSLAQAEFRQYLHEQGIPEIDDPTQRLIELLGEADAFYAFMRDKLGSIDVDEWESADERGVLQATVYVELFERAQERLQKFLVDIQRLGLEERLVRLSERQADMVCTVIERVLGTLNMPADVVNRARDEVPRQLALVAKEAAA